MIDYLTLIEVKILLLFSLKSKRLQRKAGKWLVEMPKTFVSNC
jgi:hypothetical protein